MTCTYDLLDRLASQTDPRGYTTQFTYDLLNRLTGIADPLGNGVTFDFDPNGNVTKVTDPRGGTIQYHYDSMGRVDIRTDPLGHQETYTYELTGHLKTVSDRKTQVTTFNYDDLNRRQLTTNHDSSTITYGYDATSRLTSLNDSLSGQITWVLDPLDRLTSETTLQGSVQFPDDPNPALAGYDDAGRRKRMIVSGGSTLTYTYDNADRLLTVAADGGLQATYGYDDADRRTSLELLNAVKTEYGYDNASRLTSLTYKQGMTTLGQLLYTYDAAGNRLTMGGSWARTTLPAGFTPCASSSACYDLANRHLPGVSVGGKKVTYDFNGNVTQLDDSGAITNFTWDVRNRLTALSGAASANFAYDALSRRSSKTSSGTTTTFRYDGWDIVREVIGASGVDYLRGLAIDEPLLRTEGAITTQYLSDALGSSWALRNSTGTETVVAYRYGPFGQTTVDSGSSPNAFQFTGRENDGSGLYYYRARFYHPDLQRLIAEDPIGLLGGNSNLYTYVSNNPNRYTDPFGLEALIIGARGPFRVGTRPIPSQRLAPGQRPPRVIPEETAPPRLRPVDGPPPNVGPRWWRNPNPFGQDKPGPFDPCIFLHDGCVGPPVLTGPPLSPGAPSRTPRLPGAREKEEPKVLPPDNDISDEIDRMTNPRNPCFPDPSCRNYLRL